MTPYDTALRVQRRQVDAVKVAISLEIDRITTLEQQLLQNIESLKTERALASAVPVSTDAFIERMKNERIRLEQATRMAQMRLDQLRAQAIDAYGTMRAIESAAKRYQDEADRAADLAEQGAIDDIAAARFMRARRKRRPA